MGTLAEHKDKWQHNRRYLATIPDNYCDWMVTAAFYTAVHAVEALFFKDNIPHGGNHENRNAILKRVRYATIWKAFRPLYEASLVARYDCHVGPTSSGWISAEDVREIFVKIRLHEVERLVIKLLSFDRKEFPPVYDLVTKKPSTNVLPHDSAADSPTTKSPPP